MVEDCREQLAQRLLVQDLKGLLNGGAVDENWEGEKALDITTVMMVLLFQSHTNIDYMPPTASNNGFQRCGRKFNLPCTSSTDSNLNRGMAAHNIVTQCPRRLVYIDIGSFRSRIRNRSDTNFYTCYLPQVRIVATAVNAQRSIQHQDITA